MIPSYWTRYWVSFVSTMSIRSQIETLPHYLKISDLEVEVVRKNIKNLHLGVYPPDGRVRVAAPTLVSDDAVRLAVINKLGWIRRRRSDFEAQPRQSEREMVDGETHFFLGRRYRMRLVERVGRASIVLNGAFLEVRCPAGFTEEQRERLLGTWQRQQLRRLVPPLLEKWQTIVGAEASDWGIKRMKTKWGTCNIEDRRIWVNLELIKKPMECLEYVVVHELVHLLERNHNTRFVALMDEFLPNWRASRELLNAYPLRDEVWPAAERN